jgi:succinyl-CoA synthetase beta subunit
MMLVEHDGKALLARYGITTPEGILLDSTDVVPTFDFPWVVKAQVPVGGRGKAGGIAVVHTTDAFKEQLNRLLSITIRGHQVRQCRIEQVVSGSECYISLMLNPATALVAVLMSESGGVDVERGNEEGAMLHANAAFDRACVLDAINTLASQLAKPAAVAMRDVGKRLVDAFFSLELVLVEINPLFVHPDGSWVAGDAKVVSDDNAIDRQPALLELLQTRAEAYPDVARKVDCGFDFVCLDPQGDVGLVTTGAGLSMQLVDELTQRGCRPFNFCDIRTGQFRGNPARLVQALRWISEGPRVKVVIMNFFAGVTDLGELAGLIVQALDQSPDLKVPVVIRLIGNRLDAALEILGSAQRCLHVESDLERAITQVIDIAHPTASPATRS